MSESTSSKIIPIFPLNTLLVPYSYLPLQIFENRYHQMLEDVSHTDNIFGISFIKSGQEVGKSAEPYKIGTIAKIIQQTPVSGHRVFVSVFGQERFHIDTISNNHSYMTAQIHYYKETEQDKLKPKLVHKINAAIAEYIRAVSGLDGSWRRNISIPTDSIHLSYFILDTLLIKPIEKQILLEVQSLITRLQMELQIIEREIKVLRELLGSNKILTKHFYKN